MPMLTSLRWTCKHLSHTTTDLGQSSQLRSILLEGNFGISATEGTLYLLIEPSKLVFRDNYKAEDVIRSCWNFLAVAPFLEELYLVFEDGLNLLSSPLDNNRPVHHGLRRLRLHPSKGSDDFINNVTLPLLVALKLPCAVAPFEQVDRRPCLKLLHFFERSLPPLMYFDIGASGCHDFEDSFIPCLKLLPTLERLHVAMAPVSVRLFHELTVPESGNGNIVCPALKVLIFHRLECLDTVACAEVLISTLESRARITTTFRDNNMEMKAMLLMDLMVGELRHEFKHM